MSKLNFENTPVENTQKVDNKGCLKAIIVLIIFIIVVWSIGKCSDTKEEPFVSNNAISLNDSISKAVTDVNEKAIAEENATKAKQLKSLFVEKKDEFEPYTWIKPKSRPLYINQNGFYCYFIKNKDGSVNNFRFTGQYAADDWLFIKYIKFNIDGKSFEFYPDEMNKDNDSEIWEWFDQNVRGTDIVLLNAIANAKSVKMRFVGQQYQKDKTMSSANIKSIKNTIEYYKALGGKF